MNKAALVALRRPDANVEEVETRPAKHDEFLVAALNGHLKSRPIEELVKARKKPKP